MVATMDIFRPLNAWRYATNGRAYLSGYMITQMTPHTEKIERIDADGTYHMKIMKSGEAIAEYKMKPTVRKFAQGFKGKLEKLGMYVAQDSNGCERKGLRNIGELILNIAKRIR